MDREDFEQSLDRAEPPAQASSELHALWWDAKGDWDEAHRVAQALPDPNGARIHAYLHRKEGDLGNASYWYARARTQPCSGSLRDEWATLVELMLRSTCGSARSGSDPK